MRIPISIRTRGGRKLVIAPDGKTDWASHCTRSKRWLHQSQQASQRSPATTAGDDFAKDSGDASGTIKRGQKRSSSDLAGDCYLTFFVESLAELDPATAVRRADR